jgi:uncharacterized protein (DUF1810 family)
MSPPSNDRFNLARFESAQAPLYEQALGELRQGRKESHWMWFVFPQLAGLGTSSMARHYAIQGREEAAAYLLHPVLGSRLLECCRTLLAVNGRSAAEIFGSPDDLKLRSSMTLFAQMADPGSVFSQVVDRFYAGEMDGRTLELLEVVSDPGP